MKLQTQNFSSTSHSTPSSISIDETIKQKKLILSHLLLDYLKTTSHVQASTHIVEKKNDTKSYTFFCSTLTKT
jgi:hypothetical protein